MFFFPYRAQIALRSIPFLTIGVTLLCLFVFSAQYRNETKIFVGTYVFCAQKFSPGFRQALSKLTGEATMDSCIETMLDIHLTRDRKRHIDALARGIGATPGVRNANLNSYFTDILNDNYSSFRNYAPPYMTAGLWYYPDSWDPVRMLTASVSHSSWLHVLGNLFFFFVFAATVELILGPIIYLGVLLTLAVGTHVIYSLAMYGQPSPIPTIGLSGVVMGLIMLFTYFLPRVKIRCFFWLLFFFRRFGIPAWILAVWYIGWDLFGVSMSGNDPQINFIAHLAGAALGLTMGIVLFRKKKYWAREMVES